ncbi:MULTISPECIES: DUF2867 domain-containing protein [Bradyrhizobium]|jgi:Protein of unknown function (DUF2867)|uniref:DUF2867 domain-containing protein n=1 Tax=Bradyrhizobium elkanii TaxID=29448 RepID=A0A8I1Y9N0_BRAEL|nr:MULTISPECIES: DUF2867 domain-containing protein [Bradyrhizobium]MBP1292578.1 hypothetical protein [Bradyrhizobium elkanii]MCP1926919.1 hypothetical protein [Bradyrhizobium elkanii]MCS3475557.1 hypothetical protein [Bradyrhizobium elkanii]MCS3582404.1 hypothetical protein [Bradyrhizobium elkanii]MCS3715971.1 hypothetical protein [Bradyrhizobium elkanii]
MRVDEVTPNVDSAALLAGAQFIDAFRIATARPDLDARHAAEAMVARQPRWIEWLLALRNFIVAPLGLKTSGAADGAARDMIGIFPVVSETPERLVAGFNDKHLDFRLVVDVASAGAVRSITATTLVLTHNWFGRAYLTVILPFHRLIVPAMLRKAGG